MGISLDDLMALDGKEIEVGFSSSKLHQVNESTKKFGESMGLKTPSSPLDMASLAKILNDGYFNNLVGIPVEGRPFMDNAFREIKRNFGSIMKSSLSSPNPELSMANQFKKIIEDSMVNYAYQENSPRTEKAKGSSTPLIDSGELHNSVEVFNV